MISFTVFVGYFVRLWMSDSIEQSNGPVSRALAKGHCVLDLPSSAHNVQYASIVGGVQYTEAFVRFEAPAPDCLAYASGLLAKSSPSKPSLPAPTLQPTSHPARPGNDSKLHVEWFDIENIAEGVTAGEHTSEPQIWIDTKRGIFYYRATD